MKTVYALKIRERDDYFYSHNTFVCEILNIDENDFKVVEHITLENGVEVRKITKTLYKVNSEYKELNKNDTHFDSLDEVKKYFKYNYELVKSSKHAFYFLDTETLDTVYTITNIYNCANGFVNLRELLNLEYKDENEIK